jgi:hypothetical protein
MESPTAHVFLESYSIAAIAYFNAADRFRNLVGSDEGFSSAQRHAKQTSARCRADRVALQEHHLEYGCITTTWNPIRNETPPRFGSTQNSRISGALERIWRSNFVGPFSRLDQ